MASPIRRLRAIAQQAIAAGEEGELARALMAFVWSVDEHDAASRLVALDPTAAESPLVAARLDLRASIERNLSYLCAADEAQVDLPLPGVPSCAG